MKMCVYMLDYDNGRDNGGGTYSGEAVCARGRGSESERVK